jgi:hypothetical protein
VDDLREIVALVEKGGGFRSMNDALPEGWALASLAELTANPKHDIVSGPFGSNLKSEEYVAEGVPIIRLQNVDGNRFLEKKHAFHHAKEGARVISAHFPSRRHRNHEAWRSVGQSLHRSEIVASRRRRYGRCSRSLGRKPLLQTLTPCLQSTRRQ